MKKLGLFGFILMIMSSCQLKNYEKLDDGVIIRLKKQANNIARTIQLQVINKDIIHVMASPKNIIPNEKSLMIIDKERNADKWELVKNRDHIQIKTEDIDAIVSTTTGEIVFTDKDGNVILQENKGGGKSFEQTTIDSETVSTVRQVFESPSHEAFYGLGQHQHDIFNYKGQDVDLTQHNIAVAIPFLVSTNNYGILWDNYSRTKFGDVREYEQLETLRLYTQDGIEGGLSAKYMLNNDENKLVTLRKESKIAYEFLDSFSNFPENFDLNYGKVIWEGFLESDYTGLHKFLLYSSGYTKLWINNQLLIDSWRQPWNPFSRQIKLPLEKGTKYPIKIEWVPDGGLAFIGFKWLSPNDKDEQNKLSLFSEVGDKIDYYFIYGNNLDEIIHGYRDLTGKAPIVPKWAMGFWQSRERYKTQEELLSVVKAFRKRKIPIDNIVLDWQYWPEDQWGSQDFDKNRFPNPESMINELHNKLHTRIMISVWPKFYKGIENYNLFAKNGWLYKRNIEMGRKDWVGPGYQSTFYDAFNAEAGQFFWKIISQKLFSKGIDAWWLDATEPDMHSNLSVRERKLLMNPTALGPASKYFNAYSLMITKSVYEGQIKEKPDQRVFLLTRSAYAGQQRYAAATWSGDIVTRWYDLKAQISAGLNFSLSGIPYWTTDIGGFSVEKRYEKAKGNDLDEWLEINTRWFQFGTFCPLFRVHGQFPYREMFNIAPEEHITYKTMLYYDKLRYRLMPYIYSLAGKTYHNDYTIMRALVMDFASDTMVNNIGDEFMFGPDLLICPVYEYKARSRKVYLPNTHGWYDLYSGEYYRGGQALYVNAPLNIIPVFVKEGSILPFGPEIQYTSEKPADPLTLYVYTGKDGIFEIYEDEDTNNNYVHEAYTIITFTYTENNKTLTIGKIKGKYDGMIPERTIRLVWMNKNDPKKLDLNSPPDKTVNYAGEEIKISMQ